MKKISLFVAAALLMSSVTFAQTATPSTKKQEPAKTEKKEEKKEMKSEKKEEKPAKKAEMKKESAKKESTEAPKTK